MNANTIINMIIRQVMRRVIGKGINAGMGAVGKRMSKDKPEQAPVPGSEDMGKRMRAGRKIGKL